jgi:cell division protein FtsB
MVAKKRKKFNFKKIKDILIFLLISFLIVLLIISCFNIFQKRMATEKELNILNEELNELKKENDILNYTLGETYSDEFLERIAREDLGMQKPGETIYIIKKEADEIELEEEKSYNFFERVTNWLKEIMPE